MNTTTSSNSPLKAQTIIDELKNLSYVGKWTIAAAAWLPYVAATESLSTFEIVVPVVSSFSDVVELPDIGAEPVPQHYVVQNFPISFDPLSTSQEMSWYRYVSVDSRGVVEGGKQSLAQGAKEQERLAPHLRCSEPRNKATSYMGLIGSSVQCRAPRPPFDPPVSDPFDPPPRLSVDKGLT